MWKMKILHVIVCSIFMHSCLLHFDYDLGLSQNYPSVDKISHRILSDHRKGKPVTDWTGQGIGNISCQ